MLFDLRKKLGIFIWNFYAIKTICYFSNFNPYEVGFILGKIVVLLHKMAE